MKKYVFLSVIVLLCAVLAFSVFNALKIYVNNGTEDEYVSRVIERNGEKYYPKQDITTLLVIGLDRTGPAVASSGYINSARADVVMLVVFNDSDKEINVLNLNRDTVLPVQVLGVNGYPAGTKNEQLALAHTYGTGLKDSCQNVKETVSSFLYNTQIDYYVSVSMDCISLINDSVGGVEVYVTDDFSSVNPSISFGKVLLQGEQATAYVRYRKDVGDQLNISRMSRQNQYLQGLFGAIKYKSTQSPNFILEIYDKISDYTVTDCSVQTLSLLFNKFSDYNFNKTVSPSGENVKGEEFMEFYVNSDNLDEIILDLFYSKK